MVKEFQAKAGMRVGSACPKRPASFVMMVMSTKLYGGSGGGCSGASA